MRAEARARRAARTARRCILGSDIDSEAVRMAIANAEQAGVADWVHIEKRSLSEVIRPKADVGLVVANPPYGERMGAESGLPALYSELGATLREKSARTASAAARLPGWLKRAARSESLRAVARLERTLQGA